MCPLCAAGGLSRRFLISFTVRPGNIDRKLLSMAAHNVWGTGLQYDECFFARLLQDCMS